MLRRGGHPQALAVAACVLLAMLHTWPLVTHPASLSCNDNSDAQLNEWILAWVAHQLPRSPAHLFQGNIFYPAADTLAFSEPLVVPALLGAPLAWLGASPVLVYNLLLLAGFALTALAGYTALFTWTHDRAAAVLGGSAFAFNTHTLTRLAHMQALHIYGLPLALLAADRVLTRNRSRDWLWLAASMIAMAYTSGYLAVFATVMLAVLLLVRIGEWAPRTPEVARSFALAAMVTAVAVVPLYLPYARVAREQRMTRPIETVAEFSATPRGYLATAGTIHLSTWSGRFFRDPVDSFFPGFIVTGCALAAIAFALGRRRPTTREFDRVTARRVWMLVALAGTGVVLSLGTATPIYGWLYAVFPPMRGLRAAARFGNLFLLAMAMLAGLGLATLRRRQARSWHTLALATVMILGANLESLRAPLEYRRFGGIPRIYELLAHEPGPVVLAEMPFYPRQAVFENAEYVLNSTRHWRPLMNGYSGYTPRTYLDYAEDFWHFPEDRAIEAMRRAGVTHVMVHPARFGNEAKLVIERSNARPELELVAVGGGGLRLYRVH